MTVSFGRLNVQGISCIWQTSARGSQAGPIHVNRLSQMG